MLYIYIYLLIGVLFVGISQIIDDVSGRYTSINGESYWVDFIIKLLAIIFWLPVVIFIKH